MRSRKLLALGFLGGTILACFATYLYLEKFTKKCVEINQSDISTQEVGVTGGVRVADALIEFKPNEILVNLSPETRTEVNVTEISKNTYPKLFEQGGILTAEEFYDKKNQRKFIFIARNIYGRGGYSKVYGIILDPLSGKIVYETPEELQISPIGRVSFLEDESVLKFEAHPYPFWEWAIDSRLRIVDYLSYDPNEERFVPVNNKYLDEFKRLLNEYEDIASNKCRFKGKVRPVSEILEIAGTGARCDSGLPSDLSESFITVGEFLDMQSRIKNVIEGRRSSLYPI